MSRNAFASAAVREIVTPLAAAYTGSRRDDDAVDLERQHARDAVELPRHGAAGELLAAEVAPGRRRLIRERGAT